LPAIIIGWSWGAWLGYVLAARHPELVRKLILVSSGPFEQKYAVQILETRLERLRPKRAETERLLADFESTNPATKAEALRELPRLFKKTDAFDPGDSETSSLGFQPKVYEAVSMEAEKLRSSGELLRLGEGITCPVVAIHGDYDPHPAEGVERPLGLVLHDFRFILLEHCGHTPWIERQAQDHFYEVLERELKNT
jgi:pimeloyl-ACP methyl ester carboxylesterase